MNIGRVFNPTRANRVAGKSARKTEGPGNDNILANGARNSRRLTVAVSVNSTMGSHVLLCINVDRCCWIYSQEGTYRPVETKKGRQVQSR